MVEEITEELTESLRARARYRDNYWRRHNPILPDRLLWRAQTFRHSVHLLPGQTILEIGGGRGEFTRALRQVTRGENPITSVSLESEAFPGSLAGRTFDCVVAMDLLDRESCAAFLTHVYDLLAPGGEVVFYESNPWNPILKLRSYFLRLVGKRDPRKLLSRPELANYLSAFGFMNIEAVFNDFVFAPLTPRAIWLLRNLSIVLENAPILRRLAGSIFLHAQKLPLHKQLQNVSFPAPPSLRESVSVVVPCYNEETNVRPLVTRMLELYGEYLHEIILLNDGSTDRTSQVIEELAKEDGRVHPIHRSSPHGVGCALREGISRAAGSYVFTMDCDFQHLLPEFRDLFDAIVSEVDMVIGSRFSRYSVLLNYPFLKIVANRAFHLLVAVLFGRCLRDATNNLKIMRAEVARDLLLKEPGFAANAEIGLQPFLLGYRLREVPISWINRTAEMGYSSFRLTHAGGGYARVLAGLWLRQMFRIGPYRSLHRKQQASGTRLVATCAR